MNCVEKLREYADATKWGGECRILHAHNGDFAGDCSERECGECRAAYLRTIADGADAELRDAEARLMPEGMEWPRYEDGEPVRVGDEFMGKDGKTYTVHQVQFIGKCFSLYDFCDRKAQFNAFYGERVKRPAPKVLDADGVEIKQGDTVYVLGFGEPLTVKGFTDDGRVLMSFHDEDSLGYKSSKLTHRAPVLAADGLPLREGETVWYVQTPNEAKECKVEELPEREKGERAVCLRALDGTIISCPTRYVTHERPALDADGVEIRVGEKLYDVETGCKRTVRAVNNNGTIEFYGCANLGWFAKFFTHRAPVLDADGLPIKIGDTVYGLSDGAAWFVVGLNKSKKHPVIARNDQKGAKGLRAEWLTHEQPDTWERLYLDMDNGRMTLGEFVRRCKALEEKENRNG